MALVPAAAGAVEDPHPVVQALTQYVEPEAGDPGGGELDGQRDAVKSLADVQQGALVALNVERGSRARARPANSATDGSGSSGGTVMTRSSVRPSRSRDVTRTLISGHAVRTRAVSGAAASTTCSQLSRTSSPGLVWSLSRMLRVRSAPCRSVTPRASATARGTSAGEVMVASSTSHPVVGAR